MIVEQEINKIFRRLIAEENVRIKIDESLIQVSLVDSGHKLSMSTQVYNGDNFIPQSVRKCAHSSVIGIGGLRTTLFIDENNFSISLHYLGRSDDLNSQHLNGMLEEFSSQAQEWRLSFDENDRNDRVHIRVK
jgi:hypothetical protein